MSAGRGLVRSMYKEIHPIGQAELKDCAPLRSFSLHTGICMAYYESHYNTTVQKVLEDGSTDYGIFQINSFTWCRNVRLQQKNHCHVACSGTVSVYSNCPSSGAKIRT